MKKLLSFCVLLYSISACSQSSLVFNKLDINPGSASSLPFYMQVFNGKFFFIAQNDSFGYEPWISDGTLPGTTMLKDINTGKKMSVRRPIYYTGYPIIFPELNGNLYFHAEDSAHGKELWRTDGTPNGTNLALDLMPGPNWGGAEGLTRLGNQMLFTRPHGYKLWSTDGTPQGTFMVKDIPGVQPRPSHLCEHNGRVYFTARDTTLKWDLWETDGTEQGTILVRDFETVQGIFSLNNKLLFVARTQSDGMEWWVRVGAPMLIRDINLNADSGAVRIDDKYEIKAYNGKAYFGADDGIAGIELWVTNSTYAGTHLVKDINPGRASSNPQNFTEHDGKLYFTATDPTNGSELWVTDGTDTGTHLVKDILPGIQGAIPNRLKSYGAHLYFSAMVSNGDTQLLRTDGTASGTTVVTPPGSTKSNPLAKSWSFIVYDSAMYFAADYDSSGVELWSLREIPDPDFIVPIHADNGLFAIYPNPSREFIRLHILEDFFEDASLCIYDVAGKLVFTQNIKPGNKTIIVKLPDIPPGAYVARLNLNGQMGSRQFIVK